MSANPSPQPKNEQSHAYDLLPPSQLKLAGALMLIAMGVVFLLIQAGQMSWGDPWWVIFLAVPGLLMLYTAFTVYQKEGSVTSPAVVQIVGGLVLLALTLIFIADPTWSFTRNWRVSFLDGIDWDLIWPWFLIVPGAGVILVAARDRSIEKSIPGIAMVVVGLVFVFNISWDLVWPLAIVAVGVGLLLRSSNKPKNS